MVRRLLAVLLLIPLADMLLLVLVADWLGWEATVALVVATALVGLVLVRAEGRRTLGKIQRSVARGDPPQDHLIDGGLLIAAGAFLLTPGLVTDGIGLLLVFPPTRLLIRKVLKRYVIVPAIDNRTGGFGTGTVYIGGFPEDDEGDATVDLGPEDYEVDEE
jgi:UPF0716 protein FxsA